MYAPAAVGKRRIEEATKAIMTGKNPREVRMAKVFLHMVQGKRIPRKIKKWYKNQLRSARILLDEAPSLPVDFLDEFYKTVSKPSGKVKFN